MKYFLAIDKGNIRKPEDRYKTLNLSTISSDLIKNNNLKNLVKFTCSFNSKYELKQFLISKGILDANNSHYDLVIYYEISGVKTMDVAFSCDEEFFDISRLSSLLLNLCKSETFLKTFLNKYSRYSFLSEEVGLIKEHADSVFADHKFFDAIRGFINRLCFREKEGKQVLNFKALYDLGLFVSKLSNSGRSRLVNTVPKTSISYNKERVIDEVLAFEMECLEDRKRKLENNLEEDNEQFKLF